MTKKSPSARRAAKIAKAEAKRREAEAKRAARAQAKAAKEAESKAMVVATAEEVDGLVAQLKMLVDNACDRFATDMRDAAELAFRLQDTYALTQFQIGERIGRSQQVGLRRPDMAVEGLPRHRLRAAGEAGPDETFTSDW
jgi:hypothetical protein